MIVLNVLAFSKPLEMKSRWLLECMVVTVRRGGEFTIYDLFYLLFNMVSME